MDVYLYTSMVIAIKWNNNNIFSFLRKFFILIINKSITTIINKCYYRLLSNKYFLHLLSRDLHDKSFLFFNMIAKNHILVLLVPSQWAHHGQTTYGTALYECYER